MADFGHLRDKYRFANVVWPIGGILEGVASISPAEYEPAFSIRTTALGDLSQLWPETPRMRGSGEDALGGTGTDKDPELAWVRAVVEAVERYASVTLLEEEYIWATPRKLGKLALDVETLPRVSQLELSDSYCWVRPPDMDASIRWVKGFSLTDRCERYIPVSLSHIVPRVTAAEEISIQISTGVAAHTDLNEAILSALLEVIERDAVALTWLGRLPLRRIALDEDIDDDLRRSLQLTARGTVKPFLFDATTDVGVPTIYSVQLIDGHPTASQTVACAAGFDAYNLAEKVLREAAACRLVIKTEKEDDPPASEIRDFYRLIDGARYMGSAERREAFDFLLRQEPTATLSEISMGAGRTEERLSALVDRFRSLEMDVCIVDLTTDEVREAGLWVIRAIVPRLMPMTTVYRARFLATPRLYEYVRAAGLPTFSEADVNHWPQPFA